ncbi:hypothetical protein GQ53DRAFT_751379 [Thozetella sp. PMI_491]|nr:hypothetical protein GQ53DRAFT_751379 [Thozetella sp. PMI_491]
MHLAQTRFSRAKTVLSETFLLVQLSAGKLWWRRSGASRAEDVACGATTVRQLKNSHGIPATWLPFLERRRSDWAWTLMILSRLSPLSQL